MYSVVASFAFPVVHGLPDVAASQQSTDNLTVKDSF